MSDVSNDNGLNADMLEGFLRESERRSKMGRTTQLRVQFDPPFFTKHSEPFGFLTRAREDQALFYYYVLAVSNLSREDTELVYEGDPDLDPRYEQLFKNCAMMYKVDVNQLANRWPVIEGELGRYNLNVLMPDGKELLKPLPARCKFLNKTIHIVGKDSLN